MFLISTSKNKTNKKTKTKQKNTTLNKSTDIKTDISPGKELKLFILWQKRLFDKVDIQDQ